MNESTEEKVEKIKGKYGTHQAFITGCFSVLCAFIAFLAAYAPNNDLRQDISDLKEQVSSLQNEISAFQKAKSLELGDIVGESYGFKQERNEAGELLNQYTLEVSSEIVCKLGGKFEHFHARLSRKDVEGYKHKIYFYISLDSNIDSSWFLDSDFEEIPINVDVTNVQEMKIGVLFPAASYHAQETPEYAVLSDTEIR